MRIVSLFATLALVGGCASAGAHDAADRTDPSTTQIQTTYGNYNTQVVRDSRTSSRQVAATRQRVWEALPAVFEELGVPTDITDRDAWLMGNPGVRLTRIAGGRASRFFNCGTTPLGAPLADAATLQLEILTSLTEEGDNTEVTTTIAARARPRSGNARDVECTSTGRMEMLIVERLNDLAGARGS